MAEKKTPTQETPEAQGGAPGQSPQFGIQKLYVKDMSFEAPNSPGLFTEADPWQPDINVNLSNTSKPMGEDLFEIVLTVTVTAKHNEKTAFLVEVQQAGIFGIRGIEQEQLAQMIGSYCPGILFPFARQVVSQLVTQGGFPSLVLTPINFEALYAQQTQQMKKQGGAQAVPASDISL